MNIKKAKYILKQNGYIINETKKVKRIENRKLLHEAGFTDILVPILVESKLSDKQAEEMFSRLVKEITEKEGIAETLKAENQMLWVQRMNAVREAAIEIVNNDLIYA